GGELERNRPARVMRGGAEPPLLLEGVDLDDGAVGVVAERVAVGLQPPAVVDHRVERRAGLRPRIRLEAGLAERRDRVRVRAESELAPLARSAPARRGARCRGRRSSARRRTPGACRAARGPGAPRTRAGRRGTWRCRARAWPRGAPPGGRRPRAGRPRAGWGCRA